MVICVAALIPRVSLPLNLLMAVLWGQTYSHNIRRVICESNGVVTFGKDFTLSGRSVFVQWPALAHRYPKAEYAGILV